MRRKDAQVEEALPDGWDIVRFGDIAEIGNGLVSPSDPTYRAYLHIGPENIESGTGRVFNLQTAEEIGLISGKYLFDPDAIVYSKIRPNLNKVCTPDFTGICSADAYPIWPRKKYVTKDYLSLYMRSKEFVKQSVSTSMRSGIPKINKDDLSSLWVRLPPIKEQIYITEILMDWDVVNYRLVRLIEIKTDYKRALAERLLAGQNRFPKFASQAWQEYHLGDLFSERNECNRLDLKLLAVTENEGVVDRNDLIKRDTSSEDKSKYLRVAPGDIVYNTMRMWQGRGGLATQEGIVSPAYTVCIPNERIDGRFAAYLFKTSALIAKFRRYSQGLVDDTLSLKFPNFARIKVEIPNLPEQRKIADLLDLAEQEIAFLRFELAVQKKQKQGLMQKLLTGEVRVKGADP